MALAGDEFAKFAERLASLADAPVAKDMVGALAYFIFGEMF